MQFTGELVNVTTDWNTGKVHVTFTLNEKNELASLEGIKDAKLDIKDEATFDDDVTVKSGMLSDLIDTSQGIPKEIKHNFFIHNKPYEGDNGIQFKARKEEYKNIEFQAMRKKSIEELIKKSKS